MLQGEPVASISDNPVSATLPIALGSGTGKDEQRGSTSALIPQTGSTQPFNDDLQTQRKLAALASMGDPIGDNNRQPFTNSSSNNNTFERVLERPLDYGTRKIVAENLQWNVDAVTKLSQLCLDAIVKNFASIKSDGMGMFC